MYYSTSFLVSPDIKPRPAVHDREVTVWQEKELNWCSFPGPTDCGSRRDHCNHAACALPCWTSPDHPCNSCLCTSAAFSKGTKLWAKEFQDGDFSLHEAGMGRAEFNQQLSPSQELCPICLGTGASTFWHTAHLRLAQLLLARFCFCLHRCVMRPQFGFAEGASTVLGTHAK